MPVVVMYRPSAFPCSTTLVSPPTIGTPARRAASPMALISSRRMSVDVPASTITLQTSAMGIAPATARSFTVPFTASSPIEPPGNLSGLTTKLSVVIARRSAPESMAAASPSSSPAPTSGAISPSTRRRLAFPPAPCAISMCVSEKTSGRGPAIVVMSDRRGAGAPVHVVEVRGAGAFRRDHQRSGRTLGRALTAEQLALVRLQHALQDLAALRRLWIGHLNAGHIEPRFSVPRGVVGAEFQGRLRDEPEPPPFEVRPKFEDVGQRA